MTEATGNETAQAHGTDPARAARMRRLLAILAGAAALSLLLDVAMFIADPRAWQFLALAAATGLPLLLIVVTNHLVRDRALDRAGYLILAGIAMVLTSSQLFLSGVTAILAVVGVLLLGLASLICLPRHRLEWLALAAIYVGSVVAIDGLEPLPRYAIARSPVLTICLPLLAAALVLAVLGLLLRSLRVGTLRGRLLAALVGATLLPIAIIGAGLVVVGARNERQQVLDRLEAVATLKESQVNAWTASLQADLGLVAADWESGDLEFGEAVRRRMEAVVRETGRFEELLVLDREGVVVVSTDPGHEGLSYASQAFFAEGRDGPYLQRPSYSASDMKVYAFAARPLRVGGGTTASDDFAGVLVGRTNLAALDSLLQERAGLGETGETYLVAAGTMLTPNRAGKQGFYVESRGIDRALQQHAVGAGRYENYDAQPVLGAYRWLPELQVALMAEEQQAEARSRILVILLLLAGITLVGVLAAVVAARFLVRSIANPLAGLAATAGQIAAGNLDLEVEVGRSDEIGALARSFNAMAERLRELVGNLEARVTDRTRDLARRSSYLEAAAGVSRAAVSILDPAELMQGVVEQISERFGLYYAGLFMVDESGEWAVLQANAGQADSPLPALGQRLGIGNTSMIGWCISNARTRNAPEALADTVRVPRPELPRTRAEAALPLMSRGRVSGALTVQHTEPGAFDEDTIVVLQTMADQIAVALDNARLFAEREEALAATQRAYGELSEEAWAGILQSGAVLGYRAGERGVRAVREVWRPEMEQAMQTGATVRGPLNRALSPAPATAPAGDGDGSGGVRPLAVPIKVRGRVVGVLDTYKPAEAGDWTPDEIALLEAIAGQLDAALESARLYQDTQRRAAREKAIRHVTEEMRRAVDVEAILQSTVTELAKALGARRAYVRLGPDLPLTQTRSSAPTTAGAGEEERPLGPGMALGGDGAAGEV